MLGLYANACWTVLCLLGSSQVLKRFSPSLALYTYMKHRSCTYRRQLVAAGSVGIVPAVGMDASITGYLDMICWLEGYMACPITTAFPSVMNGYRNEVQPINIPMCNW